MLDDAPALAAVLLDVVGGLALAARLAAHRHALERGALAVPLAATTATAATASRLGTLLLKEGLVWPCSLNTLCALGGGLAALGAARLCSWRGGHSYHC